MKKHGFGKAGIWFAAAELFLIASALVLGIFSVYKTISLVLFSAAVMPALYAALAVYSRKNIKTARVLTIALSAFSSTIFRNWSSIPQSSNSLGFLSGRNS